MNWLDRTIAAISPQWAYKRVAWRSGMDALYDSGSRGRTNTNWNPQQSADENRLRAERDLIRARARDLERNSDIAESIISAFERHVVGSGMTLQSKAEDEKLSDEAEELWREFCKAENCDITGTQSLEEMEEMFVRRYVVDGGILIVKVNVSDPRFPFKLQVREVDELATTIIGGSGNNRIIDGIELNEHNRPVAYHFKKIVNNLALPGESIRVPAENVIYWRKKGSPRQVREISMLATAMNRIKDANQFMEAVSIKERVLACLSVFIKKSTPSTGIGRNVNTNQEQINYDGVSLSPGMIGELNPGDEVQTVIPAGQASNTKEFIMTLLRLIGSGIGLSYETISRDMSNVNYSSARQAIIEDRRTFKKMQQSLIRNVLTPIYLEFFDAAVLTNQLKVPNYMANRNKLSAHVWIPPGSTWIDPMKEVNANKAAMESNQDTLQRICAERGEDWRDVVKQRAAEVKFIQKQIGGGNGVDASSGDSNTDKKSA